MKTFYELPITNAERSSWLMNKSLNTHNMVSMTAVINIEKIEKIREKFKQAELPAPSYTAIVVKAAAILMQRNPEANRAILGIPFFKKLFQFNTIEIAVAVEKSLPYLPGAAYAQKITNTNVKTLDEITQELKDLSNCTVESNSVYRFYMNILKYVPRPFSRWFLDAPNWFPKLWIKYRGCACWVNSPSRYGADLVWTTWPWPITISFGVIKKRPFVVNDQVKAVNTMPLLLVFDRRIMGGGPAARLFAELKTILEEADSQLFPEIEIANSLV